MSNTELSKLVVVGVDGSTDALHALDWAANKAAQHGWPLRLVNAYQPIIAALPAVAVQLPEVTEESQRILEHAREWVAATHPDLAVSTMSAEGPAPRILLEASKRARLLVVGREGLGRFAELALGSVSQACAARSTTPVAVIPTDWEPPPEPHGRVVVGVDGSANCQAAVQYAFEAASERNADLLVVFAWHQPTRWPEGWPLTGDNKPRFPADYDFILSESIAGWREKYPDVAVTTIGESEHPAEALARHSAEADLVVIGGRGHGTVTGMLLGSVARAILRHVDRPIIVVHQPES
ncbi:MAG TPA: universal stress protein [Jiangellaceae bacterium]